MQIKHFLFCFLLWSMATHMLAQPTFQPGNDPKPAGKMWVMNDTYSDEFNGNSLDANKWYDYHPYWVGRDPAMFKTDAVDVTNGSMQITNYKLPAPQVVNGNTYTIACGAVVSKAQDAYYGYYECRMKASDISMSSTFWLKNPWNTNTCPKSQTELDIIECIGGAKTFPAFATHMHSNTHYIHNPCPQPQDWKSIGDNAAVGGDVSDAYHVYGAYWKDANNILFYIDGVYKYTINPSQHYSGTPFDRPMFMCMVTETYDWEIPPTDWELANLQTTTYYDWVRSWTLEDANTAAETVTLVNPPTIIAPENSYTLNVDYSANVDRDIVVEFWSATGWVTATTTTVSAGTGTVPVTVTPPAPPVPGGGYSWKVSIRPVGADWTQNIDNETIPDVTVLVEETISLIDVATILNVADSYTVDVSYTAGVDRDIIVEFWSSPSSWTAASVITVPAGSSTIPVTVNLPATSTPGTTNIWKARLLPVGETDWAQNITVDQVNDIVIVQEFAYFTYAPTYTYSTDSYLVEVYYSASTDRDIVIEFWSASGWIGSTVFPVPAGSEVTPIQVDLPAPPDPGSGYYWKCSLRPSGGDWTQNIDNGLVQGVTILAENAAFISAENTVPPANSYTVEVSYVASTDRDVNVEFWSPSGWIAETTTTVSAGIGTMLVTVNLPATASVGSGYYWKVNIRPVGTDYTQIIQGEQFTDVEVVAPCITDVLIDTPSYYTEFVRASNTVMTQGTVVIPANESSTITAGSSILLNAGFEVELGATLDVYIEGCTPAP